MSARHSNLRRYSITSDDDRVNMVAMVRITASIGELFNNEGLSYWLVPLDAVAVTSGSR